MLSERAANQTGLQYKGRSELLSQGFAFRIAFGVPDLWVIEALGSPGMQVNGPIDLRYHLFTVAACNTTGQGTAGTSRETSVDILSIRNFP